MSDESGPQEMANRADLKILTPKRVPMKPLPAPRAPAPRPSKRKGPARGKQR